MAQYRDADLRGFPPSLNRLGAATQDLIGTSGSPVSFGDVLIIAAAAFGHAGFCPVKRKEDAHGEYRLLGTSGRQPRVAAENGCSPSAACQGERICRQAAQ